MLLCLLNLVSLFSVAAYFNDIAVGAVCCRVDHSQNQKRLYIMTLGCLAPYRRLGIGNNYFWFWLLNSTNKERVTESPEQNSKWQDKSNIYVIHFLNSEDLIWALHLWLRNSHPKVIKQSKNVLSKVPYLLLKQNKLQNYC